MFLILFGLWLLLNGYFSLDIRFGEIVLFGLVISIVIEQFAFRFTKWTKEFNRFFLTNLPLFVAYGVVLLWSVITSAWNVIKVICSCKNKANPEIVTLDLPLRSEALRVILANSVTLTPGTITVSCTKEHFIVHCLRGEYMDGFADCTLVKLLVKIEKKGHKYLFGKKGKEEAQ